MSATMRPAYFRDWLCRLLRTAQATDARLKYGESADKLVGIDEVFPGEKNMAAQRIYCGRWQPVGGTNVREIKAGTKRYDHDYELLVHIDVESGLPPLEAEQRAFELYDVVHDLVAGNVVPYDATGTIALAYHAILGNTESEVGWVDTRGACQLTTRIQFHLDT